MKKTIIILALALAFAIPAFADEEIVINNDNIGQYASSNKAYSMMDEEQHRRAQEQREDNIQALVSLECTQMKGTKRANSQYYRNRCLSPEERERLEERDRNRRAEAARSNDRFNNIQSANKVNAIHREIFGY
jgi:hypothetical protein